MLAKTEVPCGVVFEKILHLHGCGEKTFRVRKLLLDGGRRQVCVGVTAVANHLPAGGHPLASYGEEWTLAGARPPLNEYEIPFYATHFLTAYLSPAFHNDRFPYTPVSLWGKFKRSDLEPEQVSPEPVVAPSPAEPAPFAFEPFTAPDERHVRAAAANHSGREQLAGAAIALACATFIAWALFGTKISRCRLRKSATRRLR
jgi:hypothetical protein